MSARLPMTLASSEWTIADHLCAVDRRCRELVHACSSNQSEIPDIAASAATYHLLAGGRRIRARLALEAAWHLGMSGSDAVAIATACELLHNASLVHDDLQDRDTTRRDTATVWHNYGANVAICTGDLLLSAAYAALAEIRPSAQLPAMMRLMHQRIAAAIQGQCADLAARTNAITSFSDYKQIVIGKSGALLSLPLELVMLGTGHVHWAETARQAAQEFAMGYQIADDLDDLDKDDDDSTATPALNAFLVLKATRTDAQAHALGVRLGRRYLQRAANTARCLPDDAGELLCELATTLYQKL